jgi:hypothetical protein
MVPIWDYLVRWGHGRGHDLSAALNHEVTRFKSLSLALKGLEPFIRDGEHLQQAVQTLRRFAVARGAGELAAVRRS